MAHTSRSAFFFIPAYQFVLLLAAGPFPAMEIIVVMDVGGAIGPMPFPTRVGDIHFVPVPDEASGAPSPRTKGNA